MPVPGFLQNTHKKQVVDFLQSKGSKVTQDKADYRPAPTDAANRCSECKSYEKIGFPQSSCSKVVGIVRGEGTCDLFEQRDTSQDHMQPKVEIHVHGA